MHFRSTRIKFIWGSAKVIRARWRFGLWGFYERVDGLANSGLAVSVRGVLIVGLLLCMLAYAGAATGVYLWLDRRPHNYVTFTDVLLLPARWDEVRAKRGQAYLDDGIADMRAQRWAQGEMKLRIGLARYPQALPARLALAQFYFLTQRAPLAMQVLRDGMDATAGYPGRRYLTMYFSIALQGEDYGSVREACERYLTGDKAAGIAPKEHDWLLQQKLGALLGEEQPEQALALLEHAPDNIIYNEQRALTLLTLGRAGEAVKFLDGWRQSAGATPQILRLQVRAYRETHQLDRMDATLETLRQLQPADPRTCAYAVIQRQLAGQGKAARQTLDDYFFRFGGFAANLLLIAQPLAEIGELPMLQQCVARATEQGYDLRPFLLLLVQAQLKAGDWSGAEKTMGRLDAMSTLGRTAREVAAAELAGLLADVATDPSDGPQVALLNHLSTQLYPYRTYRMIVETLVRAGRHDVALEVISRSERRFPGNAGLAKFKAQAEAALAAQKARQPAAGNVIQDAPVYVESAFFPRVDAALAAGHFSEALSLTRDLQQARPAWLKVREQDVLTRQMRAAHGAHETLQMTLSARLLLDGSLARSQVVVDYAQELRNLGETDDGVLLLREVLRKTPNHALARRLLDAWSAKPDKAAADPED
jgi:hypothetical protein